MIGLGLGINRAALPQAFAELNLLSPTLDPRITFTGGPVTYVGADGLLHTSAANEWPLGYDPVTLQPVGRSAWEQRTNLLLNSGAPATQSVPTTAQSYTLSFTGTGTVTLSGTYAGSLVGTGTGPANRVNLTFTATAGTLTVTPSGSVQNFQLEAAGTAGPYIPTTSAQVTRAAQIATVNDLTTLRFNAAQGTLYAEWTPGSPGLTCAVAALYKDTNNFIAVEQVVPGATTLGRVRVSGTLYDMSGPVVSGRSKIALAYSANNNTTSVNGSAAIPNTAAPTPAGLIALNIGNYANSAVNAPIRRIRYYPRRLPDAQLQALTT